MKGQSVISPNAKRTQPPHHDQRRRQGGARDGAFTRLRKEGVKVNRNWTSVRLVQAVEKHTGTPNQGDWVDYLLRFARGYAEQPGMAECRGADFMRAPPMRTSPAMRMAQERASASQPHIMAMTSSVSNAWTF